MRRFIRDERGAIAAWFVLSLVVFLGMTALAIDVSYGIYTRNELQVTASAAALAGASQLPDEAEVTNKALAYSQKNMTVAEHGTVLAAGDVVTGEWDPDTRSFTAGITPPNAVQVTTGRAAANNNPLDLFFGGIIGNGQMDITTTAVAVYGGPAVLACMLILDPTAPEAFHLRGTVDIEANGCGIQVNSCHASRAMYAHGQPAIVDAGAINVCGTYLEQGTVNINPSPNDDDPNNVIADPFRDNQVLEAMSDPSFAPCDHFGESYAGAADHIIQTDTNGDGIYVHCGDVRVQGGGDTTFASGLHIFRNATLDIQAANALTGNGVTFVMQNGRLDWEGANSYCLSAGIEGFLVYQDKDTPDYAVFHDMGGDAGAGLNGILYFGMQHVQLRGTTDITPGCTPSECNAIVAGTLETQGTVFVELASNCAAAPEIVSSYPLRLVK